MAGRFEDHSGLRKQLANDPQPYSTSHHVAPAPESRARPPDMSHSLIVPTWADAHNIRWLDSYS